MVEVTPDVPHLFSALSSYSPRYSLLGRVPGTELYVDMETHRGVRDCKTVSRLTTVKENC